MGAEHSRLSDLDTWYQVHFKMSKKFHLGRKINLKLDISAKILLMTLRDSSSNWLHEEKKNRVPLASTEGLRYSTIPS